MMQPIMKDCFLSIEQNLNHETTNFGFEIIENEEDLFYKNVYRTEFSDLESDVYTLLYCIREDVSEDIEDKILFSGYSSSTRELFYQIFLHLSNQEILQVEDFNEKETKAFIEGLIEIFHEYPELYLYFEQPKEKDLYVTTLEGKYGEPIYISPILTIILKYFYKY